MTFIVLVILVVIGVVAYRYRVPLIARITGQKESRIRRALDPASASTYHARCAARRSVAD